MKTIVESRPDLIEGLLSNRRDDSFIVDPETYYYFRDQILIEGVKDYRNQRKAIADPPKEWADAETENSTRKILLEKAVKATNTLIIVSRYYKEWKQKQPKFYEYKGKVYSFSFLGFLNVGNEIELIQWEVEDLSSILNEVYHHPIRVLKYFFK